MTTAAIVGRGDVAVVHVCTPHHEHASVARGCLAVGVHVLTEKP